MRVYRGRAGTVDADRAVTERVVASVAREQRDRRAAVRVWTPPCQVAFGRRDAAAEGYELAREAARERGFPPVEREVGGRAVAFTGATVAFLRATPVAGPRSALRERYDAALADLLSALAALDVDAAEGEPPASFCPGSHSLQASSSRGQRPGPDERSPVSNGDAGKLAGLAQRVREDVAVVAGVLFVRDHEAVADVLGPVYAALDVPFDPGTVGSVALAGGATDPEAVVAAVEDALVGDGPVRVETVAAEE